MSMVMKDDGFDIPPKSAAVVFNEDGTIDVCIPKLNEEEDIPSNVTHAVALMLMLGDNESQIWKLIDDKVEEMIRESEIEAATEE